MQPKDNPLASSSTNDSALTDERSVQIPARDISHSFIAPDRQAAASIARNQIDQLYDTNPPNQLKNEVENQPASGANEPNPYHRSHNPNALSEASQSDVWKRYHSSWQNYYQQYYQRYYMQQLVQQSGVAHVNDGESEKAKAPNANSTEPQKRELTKAEATKQIKDEILQKVKKQAGEVRNSVHFMPIVTAVVVGLTFMFIQYNQLFSAQVKAYVSPGSAMQQNIIVDPTTSTAVGPEPKVIIPKINVDAPVIYGVTSLADGPVQVALRDGVVHYPIPGANSVPGQVGNTVLLGHSSNDVFDNGQYKFVFVLLERLEPGDTFYIHYNGTRYTYSVTKKEVIDPTEVSKLTVATDKPLATLVTCVPPGTALKRLVIWAEQISPDPTQASQAPPKAENSNPIAIPGDGQTLFERLFGRD